MVQLGIPRLLKKFMPCHIDAWSCFLPSTYKVNSLFSSWNVTTKCVHVFSLISWLLFNSSTNTSPPWITVEWKCRSLTDRKKPSDPPSVCLISAYIVGDWPLVGNCKYNHSETVKLPPVTSKQGVLTYDVDVLKVSDLLSGHRPMLNSDALLELKINLKNTFRFKNLLSN